MARHLFLSLCFLVVLATSSSHAASTCSRSLHNVLESTACINHRLLTTGASRSTIDATTTSDVCVDSLRALLTTTELTPCSTSLTHATTHHTRQLKGTVINSDSGPFEGKLNCTFDTSAPLNVSDLTQSFIIDCKEITKPYNYLWVYIVLGFLGGCGALFGLYVGGEYCIAKSKVYLESRRERRRQEAIDRAEAPPAGHPYALA